MSKIATCWGIIVEVDPRARDVVEEETLTGRAGMESGRLFGTVRCTEESQGKEWRSLPTRAGAINFRTIYVGW